MSNSSGAQHLLFCSSGYGEYLDREARRAISALRIGGTIPVNVRGRKAGESYQVNILMGSHDWIVGRAKSSYNRCFNFARLQLSRATHITKDAPLKGVRYEGP